MPAAVRILHLLVIHTQLAQDRGDHVGYRHTVDDRLVAKLVRFAVNQAFFEAATGKPNGESIAVMVAAIAVLGGRQAAELAGPHDDRAIQQAAALQSLR